MVHRLLSRQYFPNFGCISILVHHDDWTHHQWLRDRRIKCNDPGVPRRDSANSCTRSYSKYYPTTHCRKRLNNGKNLLISELLGLLLSTSNHYRYTYRLSHQFWNCQLDWQITMARPGRSQFLLGFCARVWHLVLPRNSST